MNTQALNCESPIEVDVLLVGLGPVGAALANLLGRYGVNGSEGRALGLLGPVTL